MPVREFWAYWLGLNLARLKAAATNSRAEAISRAEANSEDKGKFEGEFDGKFGDKCKGEELPGAPSLGRACDHCGGLFCIAFVAATFRWATLNLFFGWNAVEGGIVVSERGLELTLFPHKNIRRPAAHYVGRREYFITFCCD